MKRLAIAILLAISAFGGAVAAEDQICRAQDEGPYFLGWFEGVTPLGMQLRKTASAWQATRLSDGVYDAQCTSCRAGRGIDAWFVPRIREPAEEESNWFWTADIVLELLDHAGRVPAFFDNGLRLPPQPNSMFGVTGRTTILNVKMLDGQLRPLTVLAARERCLVLHAALFGSDGGEVDVADAQSFGSALLIERYKPPVDLR